MSRAFNPYATTSRTEPNMRLEFTNTIHGSFPEMAKGRTFVLRKMRTDSNNQLILCQCVDPTTREPDKDTFCPFCFGEGYLWDEATLPGYKVVIGSSSGQAGQETLISPGNVNLDVVTFYFKYDLSINLFPKRKSPDKVVELITDVEGVLIRPYTRDRIYRIASAIDFRADSGKLEYWKLDCYEEQVKFLNGPQG